MSYGPVRSELERALKAAKRDKLIYTRHAGTVAAARALADKIDAWDVIVQWALEDAEITGHRPKVPQNDNVSIAAFLKFMNDLGLTVSADREQKKASKASAGVKGTTPGASKLEELQTGVGLRVAR